MSDNVVPVRDTRFPHARPSVYYGHICRLSPARAFRGHRSDDWDLPTGISVRRLERAVAAATSRLQAPRVPFFMESMWHRWRLWRS